MPVENLKYRENKGMKNKNSLPVKLLNVLNFYYPLTIPGTVLLCISVYLLITSFYNNNPYSLIISILSLIVLIILGTLGRVQANQNSQVEWDSTIPLYANQNNKFLVYINKFKRFLFFRLHFQVKGRMRAGKNAYLYINEEVSSYGDDEIEVSCYFPVCGLFNAKGTLKVKDVFHLTRSRFQKQQTQILKIRPAIITNIKIPDIKAMEGFENTAKQKQADEEKYYQREYMPGDRFRDINWKATSRLSKLITKVSHITQEETKTILIIFRNLREKSNIPSFDSIVHLNYLKAWLISFLKKTKEENENYIFNVITGAGTVMLESYEEIEFYSSELGNVFFQTDSMSFANIKIPSEVFIFTTCYDKNINSILSFFSDSKINIFRTVQGNEMLEDSYIYRFFNSLEDLLLPGKWIFKRDKIKSFTLKYGDGLLIDREIKATVI